MFLSEHFALLPIATSVADIILKVILLPQSLQLSFQLYQKYHQSLEKQSKLSLLNQF